MTAEPWLTDPMLVSNEGEHPALIQRGHIDAERFATWALNQWRAEVSDYDYPLPDPDDEDDDGSTWRSIVATVRHAQAAICPVCDPDGDGPWVIYSDDPVTAFEDIHRDLFQDADEEHRAWPDCPTAEHVMAPHVVEGPFPVTVLELDNVPWP